MFKLCLMSRRPRPEAAGLQPQDPRVQARARGTLAQTGVRFDSLERAYCHDGWEIAEEPQTVAREVTLDRPRTAIAWNQSPDLGFDRAVNPYRGCEHGCIYCYARPSHAWLGMSPGLDFETRLLARPDVAQVLTRELGRKGYQVRPMGLGTNTDPWQPIEAQYRATRAVLEVLRDWKHPVTITTRGALIERDLDILGEMAAQNLAEVGITITTLDAGLARAMEPRAPAPARRLAILRKLRDAGIPARLMMSPVIPGLTDHEIEPIMQAAREAGAEVAWYSLIRLPLEVEALFRDWLERHRPGEARKVMNRIADLREGASDDTRFHSRFRGKGPTAKLIAQRVKLARKRLGYASELAPLDCTRFERPLQDGDQLSLF